ncbi:3-deoxy-8-phosphooctulonate synthase [Sphingobium subterraneum]|uniref:2-dehydro-3-deoxyphosphooctonate aldolase n=1 Tax=Sphingobium subterraneum TaxID=627688 RepID=A0A841IVY0_9SPHN|nr:3-deoxy-8-phosphooctulonate synthase [Sphingobium subterraneum]MBB6122807.1 2-dehydro-3-deoxyphosphooctonate aldolase (KDO 8-P synthase) [Sphingobium subterraneum]
MIVAGYALTPEAPLLVIAGPCVIESEAMSLAVAERLKDIGKRLPVSIIFKSSFDKANRSSSTSFRGPGIDEGLRILEKVRAETGLPVLTDIHTPEQARAAGDVVDVLQTPAFLARQTDLIEAAAATGKPVNIKKAQFMAPQDMAQVVAKAQRAAVQAGHADPAILLTERGSSFGYNTLVVDMRSLGIMAQTGCPVIFDATHSVQQPGALGDRSGGDRTQVPLLARAAVAAGVAGVFIETHPDPDAALSDGPNSWPLDRMEMLLSDLATLHALPLATR